MVLNWFRTCTDDFPFAVPTSTEEWAVLVALWFYIGPVRQWRGTLRFLQYLGDHIFILVHPNCTFLTNHTWPNSTDIFHVEAVDEPTPTPTPDLPNDAVLLLDTVVPVHVCACF